MSLSKKQIRLIPVSTFFVASLFLTLILSIAGYVFTDYVNTLNGESRHLLLEGTRWPATDPRLPSVRDLASAVAQRDFPNQLLITFIGDRNRVSVLEHRDPQGRSQPEIIVRPRDDRSGEPIANSFLGRLILGSASIAGLQVQRAHLGDIDIYAKVNDSVFVATVAARLPILFLSIAAVCIASFALGNFFARQALQPLTEVMHALEALSRGDFAPRTIFASPRGALAGLARAYNMASVAVETAIAERDAANQSMRKFAADAGHQLKTPLTIIRGRLGILTANIDETIRQHENNVQAIDRQCALMAELVENLMLLDRWEHEPEHIVTRPVDVIELLADIITVFSDTYPLRSLTLHREMHDDVLACIDPREFTFVITNVIDNALKYTPGKIDIFTNADTEHLRVRIRDEGPGIPENMQSRVFDRFFRGARRDIDGSGLGLAIARAAVERASGTITLSSAVETGTTVDIVLPRTADSRLEPREAKPTA